jgi:hypothetical protein
MKLFLIIVLNSILVFGGLIGGISATVNDEPITLYEVDEFMLKSALSKQEALKRLIDKKLYDIQLKKKGIAVDYFDIDNYLEKLAKRNGMDIVTFKSVVKQQYKDYDKFIEDIKKRLKHEKFVSAIIRGNIKFAKNDDLKIYYETHKDSYKIAQEIEVVQYSSKNKALLLSLIKNPLMLNSGIEKNEIVLKQDNINQKLKYIINQTKESNFTPIITANNLYIVFYIKSKKNIKQIPFKDVKNQILNIVMKQREDKYLKEYFDKLKLTAEIKIIR